MDSFIWSFRGNPVFDFFLVPLFAVVCGGLIGLNREFSRKAAGLRTHILVCLGCALFTEMSMYGFRLPGQEAADPSRVAAQIVTGLGFIGAGAIWKQGVNTHGLTTAASIWMTGAIGIACATGCYLHALGSTGLTLFTLSLLSRVEDRIQPYVHGLEYVVVAEAEQSAVMAVIQNAQQILSQGASSFGERHGLTVAEASGGRCRLEWRLTRCPAPELDRLVAELGRLQAVHTAWWEME